MPQAQRPPPSPDRELRIGPARLAIKIDPAVEQSGLFAFESTLPPGGGMPYLHLHHEQEEVFYVLQGTMEYTRGDEIIVATTGSLVQVPPGTAHKFRNIGDVPARHLALITPGMAGLRMMEDVAQIDFADLPSLVEVLHRHNSDLVTPATQATPEHGRNLKMP
jgi:quercetin dioxygenase-like cupin family protein